MPARRAAAARRLTLETRSCSRWHASCSRERQEIDLQKAGTMISHRFLGRTLLGALAASSALSPTEAQAQALPTPFELASSLDLECYRTPGPSLDINIQLT